MDSSIVEAILLTGGAGRRMGTDKSRLIVEGLTAAERLLGEFDRVEVPVTVLGREPITGRAFLADEEEFQGPARALSRFVAERPIVFVCSCDLLCFRAQAVCVIVNALGKHDAALPVIGSIPQYLCGAYSARVFPLWRGLVASGARSMMDFVRDLDVCLLGEAELSSAGIDTDWLKDADTPREIDG